MRTTRKAAKADLSSAAKAGDYVTATETMSVADKLTVLEGLGREDLVDIFKDWQPRQVKAKRKSAPLDQRVSITVTTQERVALQQDVAATNRIGEKTTVSQFVRNRAIAAVDINGWKEIAERALRELSEIEDSRTDLAKRERAIKAQLEEEEDSEDIAMLERELMGITGKLRKVIAQNEKRTQRLSGRMSMAEAETVKWRAARLCISTSDYLRFLVFDLIPDSAADAHMSLDSRRRFYVSIIEVATNGWGEPPTIAHCTQCSNYMEEIRRLRDRVKQLETFV